MSREAHVRFWESAGVRLPRATQLPLYRLEQIFARHGLHIPRTTQWDWVRDSADLLVAIVLEMKRLILASAKIHTDDTYIPIQDKSRRQVRQGYLWSHIDMANNVYFDYTTARNQQGPQQMLGGYQGGHPLQPDCQLQALRDRSLRVPAGRPGANQHPSGQPDR